MLAPVDGLHPSSRHVRFTLYLWLAGGKGIPESVAIHPCVFATFTAPSFGQVYSDYGYAVKNVYVQSLRIANNCRGLGSRTDPIDYSQAIADLEQLTDKRTAIWESMLLLGDPETIAAARTWHRQIWQVERFARGERTDAEAWNTVLDGVVERRTRFYAAARRDLGIDSGDIPQAGPWIEPATANSRDVATDVASST